MIFLTFRSSILPLDKPSSSEHIQNSKNASFVGNHRIKMKGKNLESVKALVLKTFWKPLYTSRMKSTFELPTWKASLWKRVFGADLFYHKICLPNYLNKYNRKLEGCKIRKKSKNEIQKWCRENEIIVAKYATARLFVITLFHLVQYSTIYFDTTFSEDRHDRRWKHV